MGENKFDKNVEIVLIDDIDVSEHFNHHGMMAEWVKASVLDLEKVLQRFETHKLI